MAQGAYLVESNHGDGIVHRADLAGQAKARAVGQANQFGRERWVARDGIAYFFEGNLIVIERLDKQLRHFGHGGQLNILEVTGDIWHENALHGGGGEYKRAPGARWFTAYR